MKTTLNAIASCDPCSPGWKKLLRFLDKKTADDTTVSLKVVAESNGIDDALWCANAVPGYERELRLFAVWCLRRIEHLITAPSLRSSIDIIEQYATGRANDLKLIDERQYISNMSYRAIYDATDTKIGWVIYDVASTDSRFKYELYRVTYALRHILTKTPINLTSFNAQSVWDIELQAQTEEFMRVCTAIENGVDPYPLVSR